MAPRNRAVATAALALVASAAGVSADAAPPNAPPAPPVPPDPATIRAAEDALVEALDDVVVPGEPTPAAAFAALDALVAQDAAARAPLEVHAPRYDLTDAGRAALLEEALAAPLTDAHLERLLETVAAELRLVEEPVDGTPYVRLAPVATLEGFVLVVPGSREHAAYLAAGAHVPPASPADGPTT